MVGKEVKLSNSNYERLINNTKYANLPYYIFLRSVNPKGGIQTSVISSWCGFTDDRPPLEIRCARKSISSKDLSNIDYMGCKALIINDENDIVFFFQYNGVAFIRKEVAEIYFDDLIKPAPVAYKEGHGFKPKEELDSKLFNRAPTKRLRMEVIQRDDFRCRICGRSPRNYIDVELHVHHIKPFCIGGLTEKNNLITLCKTCHDGLYPHYTRELECLIVKEEDPWAYYGLIQLKAFREKSLKG